MVVHGKHKMLWYMMHIYIIHYITIINDSRYMIQAYTSMIYDIWHITYDMIQLDIMWCDVIWNSFDVLWLPGPILILKNNDTWHAKESHPRIGHLVIFAPTTVPFRCAWVCSGGHAITPMRGCMVRETAITSSGQTLTSRVPPMRYFNSTSWLWLTSPWKDPPCY